jgi:hypothetical protein
MRTLTAQEVIESYRAKHSEGRFAVTDNLLGMWNASEQRYVAFAGLTLDGKWCYMPFDILVNGKQVNRNWIAV